MKDESASKSGAATRALHKQILTLVQTYFEGKSDAFYVATLQAAALLAQDGNERGARQLRELADKSRPQDDLFTHRQISPTVPLAQPRGELAGLLTVTYPQTHLRALVISNELRERLERVLEEQRESARLSGFGLHARRKLLLAGPPGTGKTMTASVLAGELRLPLFSVRLESLVTKFLGETAQKLRLVYDAIALTRGVYFFDEFDALGSRRADPTEVGEMRRALNTFLQLIEQDTSQSLILAATNHADLLDKALFRRFDDILRYQLPEPNDVEALVHRAVGTVSVDTLPPTLAEAARGLSHAEITEAAKDAAKTTILAHKTVLSGLDLLRTLRHRQQGLNH